MESIGWMYLRNAAIRLYLRRSLDLNSGRPAGRRQMRKWGSSIEEVEWN